MRALVHEVARDAESAVATVSGDPDARFIAGGSNLVDHLKLGIATPTRLVDVSRLPLAEITDLPDGGLRVGANVRNSDLAAHPVVRERYAVLSRALLAGASGQIRNQATTAGNLLQRTRCVYFQDATTPCNKREPGSGCSALEGYGRYNAILGQSPECVAVHPSDMAVAMAALDATVVVLGPDGERRVPFADLHRLPGDEPQHDTTLAHGELITAVELAALSRTAVSTYYKARDRASYAFALISTAVVLDLDGAGPDARVDDVRIAWGGVAHKPWRATRAEEALRGNSLTPQSIRAALDVELAEASTTGDTAYKVPLVRRATTMVLHQLGDDHDGGDRMTAQPTDHGQLDAVAMGARVARTEGPLKVRGAAAYAFEVPADDPLYLHLVQSTVAKGTVRSVDASAALAHHGVVAVLDHTSAPRLEPGENAELQVLQTPDVSFRGQVVAVVAAESPEAAREGARLVRVDCDVQEHHAELRAGDPEAYKPDQVNPAFPTDSNSGRMDRALENAAVVVDETYTTPYEHNNPMEPHATTARWAADGETDGPRLVLDASTQSVHGVVAELAPILGLEPGELHVRSPYVGGGFGSKGLPHAHDVVAALVARALPGRSVRIALTRQQMFALAGYRTATIQRFQLAADADGTLVGINHEVLEQTSAFKEFAEQTAVATRHMYAAPNRHTSHRLVALDVAVPSWMRAPGEMPGMAAHEIAMDELAIACGVDPIELRVRNEPEVDPESGQPFGHRKLVECLRTGAERFGWAERDPRPGSRLDGDWLVGVGVAAATYPYYRQPGNEARIEALEGARYAVSIGAADIGTGALTVLGQIAADALGVRVEDVDVHLGDSSLPQATVAGGSAGTASWGSAIVGAARTFRDEHGTSPGVGDVSTGTPPGNPQMNTHSLHSFGAQFVELGVNVWTGEPRLRRMLGVFSAGRIINPTTARSQLIGGMIMGLGGGLLEESVRDPRFGHIVTQDLASYHVASHADVPGIEAMWLEETDPLTNPMGARGIGEIGIVGAAAAVANAAWHATGIRVRELPATADRFLDLPADLPALAGHPALRA